MFPKNFISRNMRARGGNVCKSLRVKFSIASSAIGGCRETKDGEVHYYISKSEAQGPMMMEKRFLVRPMMTKMTKTMKTMRRIMKRTIP